jgi:hypothetical protein
MYQHKMIEVPYKTGGIFKAKGSDSQTVDKINEVLDSMSKEGWELISVKTPMVNAFTASVLMFFKKQIN